MRKRYAKRGRPRKTARPRKFFKFGWLSILVIFGITALYAQQGILNHQKKLQAQELLYSPVNYSKDLKLNPSEAAQAERDIKENYVIGNNDGQIQNSPSDYCVTVPVLMYHHIQPQIIANEKGQTSLTVDSSNFDTQMAYLVSFGYTSISADQLVNALITHSGLPVKPIVITMDDGYKDNYDYAYPVIQKYGLIANIMIPTGLMENPGWLSWNELKTMANSGRFYAYDHTWSHAALGDASSEKIQSEISMAKNQLGSNLGKSVNIFAYPYGSESQRVIDILKQDGFVGAFSTIPGSVQCESFIFSLHRTRIGNGPLSGYGL